MTAITVIDLDDVETVDLEEVETVALEEGEVAPIWPQSALKSHYQNAHVRRWQSAPPREAPPALLHQIQLPS